MTQAVNLKRASLLAAMEGVTDLPARSSGGHCAHPVHFVNPVILSKPSFLGAFPPSREILTDCGSLACFFKSRQESVQNQITEGDDSSAKNLQSIKKCGTDSNFIKVIVEQKKKHNP
jgi:hypothetical protein